MFRATAVFLVGMLLTLGVSLQRTTYAQVAEKKMRLDWDRNFLTISGEQIPGSEIKVHYLEAYCRAGSTAADWREHTVVGHKTELVKLSDDRTHLELRCNVNDGLVVEHVITAGIDDITFDITASNPTTKRSVAHWAQPCIRLDKFTGCDQDSYLAKSFIFVEGRLTRMPCEPWATEARYVPGQVWRPANVPAEDVNPRPLSPIHPSNGLIGCFSHDESKLFATAFEPYQELFQGVIVCLHSDFRLGGLRAGEERHIRGKIYILPNDVEELMRRYKEDFPEQTLHK